MTKDLRSFGSAGASRLQRGKIKRLALTSKPSRPDRPAHRPGTAASVMATFFDRGRHRRGGQGRQGPGAAIHDARNVKVNFCRRSAMEVLMRASGGLLVFAILLAGITADRAILSSARAEESCLATPNGPPPPDSQWLYRTDHLKQRKCWHLVARGGVGRARVIVTQPAVLGSTLDPDRPTNRQLEPLLTASPALRGSSAEGSIQQGRVGHQAGADTPMWPDPPSRAAPENMAWPAPLSPTQAGDIPGNAYS
jgi:hypothetical protein